MSTALNAASEFPGNSFPGDVEDPISAIYPTLDTCRIGLQLNAANEFPGNAVVEFMAVDVEQNKYKNEICRF